MKRITWTFEKLQEEALKYHNRAEFQKHGRGAYNAARRLGILDQTCKHMKNMAGVRIMTDNELIAIALTCNNMTELKNLDRGIYRAILGRKLSDRAFSHMPNGGYTCYPWTDQELAEEALKYKHRGDFQKYSNDAYQVAKRRKILSKICAHMENKYEYWDYKKLRKEALKYKTRTEFQKGSASAYMAAHTMGILGDICAHMEYVCYPWTDEELTEEALKYEYRADFIKYSSNAYHVACKRGILDQICKHMKSSLTTSMPERELFAIVSAFFPSTKKLRDRKVKIEDKPYIHGFDIDILVPELRLGIEVDGKYHHTFEYMRKDKFKAKWSDDDIRNYHEIKDAWFASKGIRILHIKEIDWNKNKEECIRRCLEFLGVSG
jgi:very-short-patch-repair endonuclease